MDIRETNSDYKIICKYSHLFLIYNKCCHLKVVEIKRNNELMSVNLQNIGKNVFTVYI